MSLGKVRAILEEWGYQSWPLLPSENVVERFQAENRSALKGLAIAGACAGNIMLFVIPSYAGLTGDYAKAFNWLSFLIFLPILFYSARPFYQGAWNALKYHILNVDLPITIALLTGFSLSTFSLLRGQGEMYFDSIASFIFLILSTRFVVKRVQQKSLSEGSLSEYLPVQLVRCRKSDEIISIPSINIIPGQVLIIEVDQIVPADGTIYSIAADLDVSLLNGESLPQTFSHGMKVFAGTRVVNRSMEMIVESTGKQTEIGRIISDLEKDSLKKTQFITLSDKLAQGLIGVVFLVAVLFFVIYGSLSNYQEGFNRALALIVLACPCALAFGTPLTYALALRAARKRGILVKDGSVFEKFLKVKNIFFDKTGTLTSGHLTLVQSMPPDPPQEYKQIVLGLESRSTHPVAFGFRNAWKDVEPYHFSNTTERLGFGVSGRIQGENYQIEASEKREDNGLISVKLKKDDQVLVYFYFTDQLRPDTKAVVENLRTLGLSTGILSGDREFIVRKISLEACIPESLSFSELSPIEKQMKVLEYEKVCMIGDGANDSLAIQSAFVGIAVKGSVSLCLKSCDVYLTKSGLGSLLTLWDLSKRTHSTLKRNLTLALIYNFIGGVLALFGLINPLIAAVLMPISSLIILFSTLWGIRQ
jgi:P-type Cu+ transporter